MNKKDTKPETENRVSKLERENNDLYMLLKYQMSWRPISYYPGHAKTVLVVTPDENGKWTQFRICTRETFSELDKCSYWCEIPDMNELPLVVKLVA